MLARMQTGFSKPGSNNFSESRIFRPSLVGLYGNDKRLVAEMEVPRKAWESYGAPEKVRKTKETHGFSYVFMSFQA